MQVIDNVIDNEFYHPQTLVKCGTCLGLGLCPPEQHIVIEVHLSELEPVVGYIKEQFPQHFLDVLEFDYKEIDRNVCANYCMQDPSHPPWDGRPWVARKKNKTNDNNNDIDNANNSSSSKNGNNWQTGAQFPHSFKLVPIDIVNDNVDIENNALDVFHAGRCIMSMRERAIQNESCQ